MEYGADNFSVRSFRNVKKATTKEYIFSEEQMAYPEDPLITEVYTFGRNGSMVTKTCTCSEDYHEISGLDLYDYSLECFYNEAGLPEKQISYDENAEIDGSTEYTYDEANRLKSVKTDRINSYRILEYEYFEKKVIKTLTSSITGEINKEIILYDDMGRVISEASFFRNTEGNYPVKNPSKKITYHENSMHTKYFLDDKITCEEIQHPDGNISRRINYNEDESVFSVIEFQYDGRTVITIHKNPDGGQNFKTVCYPDENGNAVKYQKFNNNDILESETETIYRYDTSGNCIYREIKNFTKYICEIEYLKY